MHLPNGPCSNKSSDTINNTAVTDTEEKVDTKKKLVAKEIYNLQLTEASKQSYNHALRNSWINNNQQLHCRYHR